MLSGVVGLSGALAHLHVEVLAIVKGVEHVSQELQVLKINMFSVLEIVLSLMKHVEAICHVLSLIALMVTSIVKSE